MTEPETPRSSLFDLRAWTRDLVFSVLIAGIIMFVNLIVDVLYGLINPRIRH